MHKNQQGALRADALGAEMEGVCRDEGRAVFVPGLHRLFPPQTAGSPTVPPIPAAAAAPAGT